MQNGAHGWVQGTDHHAIANIYANVRPMIGPVRILDHQVSRLRIKRRNHDRPLFCPRQFDPGLSIGPLDKAGTIPSPGETGAAPNVTVSQALVRGRQNVLADLGNNVRVDLREACSHGIGGPGQVGCGAVGRGEIQNFGGIGFLRREQGPRKGDLGGQALLEGRVRARRRGFLGGCASCNNFYDP